jgi:hypothetical protein
LFVIQKMELLEKKDYEKAVDTLRQVSFNNLFARAVVEKKVSGKIFVDNTDNPKTFYIIHLYGMTLLLGMSSNANFNEWFRKYALNIDSGRNKHEWMQAFPVSWNTVLIDLFGNQLIRPEKNIDNKGKGVIELNTRVNFKFSKEKYLQLQRSPISEHIKIVKTNAGLFHKMKGSVIPSSFWDNENDFFKNGYAYSLLYNNQLASTAFSSFRFDNLFEIGIETEPEFRGKGFADIVCSALIDYCLDNNYEPIWACRKENEGSYKLALKLGFEVCEEIPYYRLSN